MKKSIKYVKGISPVVATVLLLVVAVGAVTVFQGWFHTYSSGLFTKIEQDSSIGLMNTDIKAILDNSLYFDNGYNNLTIQTVKLNNYSCSIDNSYTSGMQIIDISDCLQVEQNTAEVVVVTNKGLFTKTLSLANAKFGGMTLSSSLICNNNTDGDGFISHLCANYPMIITDFEGHLDPDDSLSVVQPDMDCVFSDDKSGCEDNFVVPGCGTGTVLDIGTGLCWLQNMSMIGLQNWTNAKNNCSNLDFAGHTDWYLPSKEELMSITDLSRANPAIVGGDGGKFVNVVSGWYWTVSSYGSFNPLSDAWFVHFGHGYDYDDDKGVTFYVTCVRRNS
jgi:hypothetical protein